MLIPVVNPCHQPRLATLRRHPGLQSPPSHQSFHNRPWQRGKPRIFRKLMKLRWLEDPSGRDWSEDVKIEFLNLLGCTHVIRMWTTIKKHLGFFCKRNVKVYLSRSSPLPPTSIFHISVSSIAAFTPQQDRYKLKKLLLTFCSSKPQSQSHAMFHGWVKEKIRTNQRVDVSKPLKIYSINIYPASQPPSVPEDLEMKLPLQLDFPKSTCNRWMEPSSPPAIMA